MKDIWFSNIYFRDLDEKESKKVRLSHGSSITAIIKKKCIVPNHVFAPIS
jgi:hypothetical protein